MVDDVYTHNPHAGEVATLPPILPGTRTKSLTMPSREIADLCETRHNQLVETIERLFKKGVLRESRKTTRTYSPPGGGRPTEVYDLTKRDTLVVVSGYSDELRARIIDRWIELERQEAGAPATMPSVAVSLLDKEVKRVIGNMIKQCTGVVLRDEIAPIIAKAVQDAQRREDMHPTVDMTSTVTAADMLDLVQVKGRFRGTTQFITREMLKFTAKVGCWRTPSHVNRSQPWRFPREKAQEFLFGASLGAELVRSYVAGRTERRAKASLPVDQKVIQFRAPSTSFEGGAA